MTLKALMASDLDDVFIDEDEFAVSIVYHPVDGGGSRTFTATVSGGPFFKIEKEQYHEVKRRLVTLLIKKSDTDGITEIKRKDYIVYLGVKWDFDEVTFEDDDSLLIQWQQSKVVNAGRVNIGL